MNLRWQDIARASPIADRRKYQGDLDQDSDHDPGDDDGDEEVEAFDSVIRSRVECRLRIGFAAATRAEHEQRGQTRRDRHCVAKTARMEPPLPHENLS